MNKIKTVVIDDEFLNRGLITLLISRLNQTFEVSGEAENLRDGRSLIDKVQPEVVFVDIKMPDGSGFDLIASFSERWFEVVFITGFDEYSAEAFNQHAADYVLKPIDLDKFKITLEKLQEKIMKKRAG